MKYCVVKTESGECYLLRSLSVGEGGYRLRQNWIRFEDVNNYPNIFWSGNMDKARKIADLVGENIIGVPADLLGIK